ncbi:MAG: AAA family ATPase [Bacilli bacterium]|nr:AAA family ATPase [Bacilli bacterium]
MYLKEIRAHGFKSFAEKVNIELGKGITGIVGPNGSGKSNVVDAVRWVLGEQSVKSLRGDGNMTDVIFSGSSTRKPQNVASVSLVFDNTDQYLPLAFNEVAIKRRVYKDGSNEYFINNEKCRLKDVTDILMDSGMAKESFNIISQGKIDEILLSKPTDRRTIFEEAAGVLKYKKRKLDALRKLERTHDNMNRVEDIIKELEGRVEPLKKQKEKALYYEKVQEELKELDLSLLTFDISNLHQIFEECKQKREVLNTEILGLYSQSNKGEAEVEVFKNKISILEKEVTEKQKELLEITSLTEQFNSKKQILLERKKYEVEDAKLHTALVALKEDELKLKNQISSYALELENLKEEQQKVSGKVELLEKELQTEKENKHTEEQTLFKLLRYKENVKTKVESLRDSIESGSSLPYAIKSILENKNLKGIHQIISNLIEVEEQYTTAIATSLGAAATHIVTNDEIAAKNAVSYLKENRLGRATFFPLNIIEERSLSIPLLNSIKDAYGFVGMASDLVQYDPKYKNIIKNQLGTVVVAKDMDSASAIHKICHHKVKIVTLDGELLHIGGSITGGQQKTRNILNDKYELEKLLKEQQQTINHIQKAENNINEIDEKLKNKEDKVYLGNKEVLKIKEMLSNKEASLTVLKEELSKIESEIEGTGHILNKTLDKEEQDIIDGYYAAEKKKTELENTYRKLQQNKKDVEEELEEFEFALKKENSLYNQKSKELNTLEIEINRADVKLDNLLSYLTETYSMTYENAILKYKLTMPEKEARERLQVLKKQIREIGPVNMDAIAEYDEISKRYEFLITQKEDLLGAENVLLEIIEDMDKIMVHDFAETFALISKNFAETFRELFKGGNARLTLTDPNNLLETGVEIEACPPGKSLKSISLLSGGEKTFTAISLLFAILKSRPVPFCILDEVEAALDEANVDSFGKYLIGLKEKTQFILITHKKKTMEYADVLYGITMQESGVSKLVSVRLEELQ